MGTNSNGNQPHPQGKGVITTSWDRDDSNNKKRRFKLTATYTPLTPDERLAGPPVTIGESTLDAPSLEVARIMVAGLNQMLASQPPDILVPQQPPLVKP